MGQDKDKGVPLPRMVTRLSTQREREVQEVLDRLKAAGGDMSKLNTVDQANYAIFKNNGEIPDAPPTSPIDTIEAGLRANGEKAKEEIRQMVDYLGNLAWEAQTKVRPSSNYLLFSTREKANVRLREIQAHIDEGKVQIGKLASHLAGPEYKAFSQDVEEAIGEIERVFKGA